MPIWQIFPPYWEDNIFSWCPEAQLVVRAVRVAVRVQGCHLSSLAAVRNAVPSVQKSYQSLFLFAHLTHSVVYSHPVSDTLASLWAREVKEKKEDLQFTTAPEISPHPQHCSWLKYQHEGAIPVLLKTLDSLKPPAPGPVNCCIAWAMYLGSVSTFTLRCHERK